MDNLSCFWRWEEAVPKEMCDLLLADRKLLGEQIAGVGDDVDDETAFRPEIRQSKVCWAKQNHWVEGLLYNHAMYANESAGWHYNMGRPERVQLTAYGSSGFYDWHEDWSPFSPVAPMRKLSVVLLLSDTAEFEGGDFQFENLGTVELQKGSIIVFPSFVRHRVTPVTKGTRYSAVCWVTGPRTF